MNNLETKDQMAQQMQTIREMEVAAFECKEVSSWRTILPSISAEIHPFM